MAFDGFTIKSLVLELDGLIAGSRIEKIYQPQSDVIVLYTRTKKGKERVLLSANPSNPRLHITKGFSTNPEYPPMFCMLMRKHFHNGIITSIAQQGMDRVIEIAVKTTDELGISTTKHIVCEIMGRHSNIILLDQERRVIDSIKRVTLEMSSYRQVLPGTRYISPPPQDKINFLVSDTAEIKNKLLQFVGIKAEKAIMNAFEGIGRLLAREFCTNGGIRPDEPLETNNIDGIVKSISHFKQILNYLEFSPVIYYKDGKPFDFSPVMLKHLELPYRIQENINSMIDNFYYEKLLLEKILQTKETLTKIITALKDKNERKLETQLAEYKNAENYEDYRLFGELLTANLYRLKEKTRSVSLENFYDPELSIVEIKLNPNITPAENAQRFFREYNRGKRTIENLKRQIKNTKEEIEYLESLLFSIERCTELDDLAEIREELVREGYIKSDTKRPKEKKPSPSRPLHFVSRDGLDIYVGKNNYQNDYLTLKFASKDDLWLHTKDISGSHVIVKREGTDIPETTLYQAALLAAYYSKGRYSSNVPVDYTEVRYVSKPSGAKPGMVIYKNNKTLFVTPDVKYVNEIEER